MEKTALPLGFRRIENILIVLIERRKKRFDHTGASESLLRN